MDSTMSLDVQNARALAVLLKMFVSFYDVGTTELVTGEATDEKKIGFCFVELSSAYVWTEDLIHITDPGGKTTHKKITHPHGYRREAGNQASRGDFYTEITSRLDRGAKVDVRTACIVFRNPAHVVPAEFGFEGVYSDENSNVIARSYRFRHESQWRFVLKRNGLASLNATTLRSYSEFDRAGSGPDAQAWDFQHRGYGVQMFGHINEYTNKSPDMLDVNVLSLPSCPS